MPVSYCPFDYKNSLEKQRSLHLLCFPEIRGNVSETKKYYFWKFHHFPLQRPSYEYAAYDGESLVGYYAALPFEYSIGGERMRSGLVCDGQTDPSRRKEGIFTEMGRFATSALQKEKIDFVIGYVIRPPVIPGHLKAGWKIAFRLPVYLRLLEAKSLLKSRKIPTLLAYPIDIFLKMFNVLMTLKARLPSDYLIHTLPFSESMSLEGYDDFIRQWASSFKHHLIKDRSFLNWRLSSPESQYQIILIRQNKNLVGIIITREKNLEGIPCLAIVDFMLLKNHDKALNLIHNTLYHLAIKNNREAIVGLFSARLANRYRLLKNGFLRTPRAFKVIIKPLSDKVSTNGLGDESNWHLTWMDTDHV